MENCIVCAANRYSDGTILVGIRHWDQHMHAQATRLIDNDWIKQGEEQGFLDRYGVFHNREQALEIAKAANQIVRRCGGDERKLFSENLY